MGCKVASSEKHSQFKTRVQNHTLFYDQTYPLGPHMPIIQDNSINNIEHLLDWRGVNETKQLTVGLLLVSCAVVCSSPLQV